MQLDSIQPQVPPLNDLVTTLPQSKIVLRYEPMRPPISLVSRVGHISSKDSLCLASFHWNCLCQTRVAHPISH